MQDGNVIEEGEDGLVLEEAIHHSAGGVAGCRRASISRRDVPGWRGSGWLAEGGRLAGYRLERTRRLSGQLRQLQCRQACGSFECVTDGPDAACCIQVALGHRRAVLLFDSFSNFFSKRGQVGWCQGFIREQRVLFHVIRRVVFGGTRPFDGRLGGAGDRAKAGRGGPRSGHKFAQRCPDCWLRERIPDRPRSERWWQRRQPRVGCRWVHGKSHG